VGKVALELIDHEELVEPLGATLQVTDEQLDRTRGVPVVVEVFGRPAGDQRRDDLAGSHGHHQSAQLDHEASLAGTACPGGHKATPFSAGALAADSGVATGPAVDQA
jgi:hypothetical protein